MVSDAWKDWERAIAAEARLRGLPWERRLRGGDNQDMLDIDGPLPDGWLVGGKAIGRRVDMGDRLSAAMLQCDRAMINLEERHPGLASSVVPVQILKRQGKPVARAYAVMEYKYLLDLVVERRKWAANRRRSIARAADSLAKAEERKTQRQDEETQRDREAEFARKHSIFTAQDLAWARERLEGR